MTPKELYARTPERYDRDVSILFGCYYSHIPEIVGGSKFSSLKSDKVVIKYYKDHSFDGRRIWILASVWYEGSPVMIIQNAGREGDDWAGRFITDPERYKAMITHIQTLIPIDYTEHKDTYSEDDKIESLTSFYGYSLDGYFDYWR